MTTVQIDVCGESHECAGIGAFWFFYVPPTIALVLLGRLLRVAHDRARFTSGETGSDHSSGPLLPAASIAGVLLALGFAGALAIANSEADYDELIQGSVDDLHLSVKPRAAVAGDVVTYFVQGEPPLRLRVRPYVELIINGAPHFIMEAAPPTGKPPEAIPIPLPEGYMPPSGEVPLARRQDIRLPADLSPGTYALRGFISGHDRFHESTYFEGRPTGEIKIVVPPE